MTLNVVVLLLKKGTYLMLVSRLKIYVLYNPLTPLNKVGHKYPNVVVLML